MNKTNSGANTNVFQILLDILFLVVSYAVSILMNYNELQDREALNMLALAGVFGLINILSNK